MAFPSASQALVDKNATQRAEFVDEVSTALRGQCDRVVSGAFMVLVSAPAIHFSAMLTLLATQPLPAYVAWSGARDVPFKVFNCQLHAWLWSWRTEFFQRSSLPMTVLQIREQYAELRDEFYAGLEDRKYV
jgi:hypothetical protein